MQGGRMGDCELVRPHCQGAPLLESGDASPDSFALLVPVLGGALSVAEGTLTVWITLRAPHLVRHECLQAGWSRSGAR